MVLTIVYSHGAICICLYCLEPLTLGRAGSVSDRSFPPVADAPGSPPVADAPGSP